MTLAERLADPVATVLHLRALVELDEPMTLEQLAAWYDMTTSLAHAKLQGCPASNGQRTNRRFRPSVAREFLVGVPEPLEDE